MPGRPRNSQLSPFKSDDSWADLDAWSGRNRGGSGSGDERRRSRSLSDFSSGKTNHFPEIEMQEIRRSATVSNNSANKPASKRSELAPFSRAVNKMADFGHKAFDAQNLAKTLAKDKGAKKLGGEAGLLKQIETRMANHMNMQKQWAQHLDKHGVGSLGDLHRDHMNNALNLFASKQKKK